MVTFHKKYLIIKLLAALILVLAFSFSSLSFFLLRQQNSLLDDIDSQVNQVLVETGTTAEKSFDALGTHVGALLKEMQEGTSQSLAVSTGTALSKEKQNIQTAMESLLLKNAESISAILNSVTPTIISRKSFGDLINYSKSAAETNEIIYTLFFDKDGEPLPGHLNIKDPKIRGYVSEETDGSPIEKVLRASKKDASVMVFEHPIKFYGTNLGKTVICLNRDTVLSAIESLDSRFKILKETNSQQIESALSQGSGQVLGEIRKDLSGVSEASRQVAERSRNILNQAATKGSERMQQVLLLMGLVCTVITLILLSATLYFLIIVPLKRVADGLADTAQGEGDLTRRLELTRQDEIGVLAGWFDTFLEKLNRIITGISKDAATVRNASGDVLSEASSMSEGVTALHDRAAAVAAAAEEMSTNMTSVAAASEQAATNITQVSQAADRIKTSLNEVAENCDQARAIAKQASTDADSASNRVGQLGQAAREINKVTEVITDIAEQTNLLALNATIEAARAGTAGRGFAVVASEIKGLAAQTAGATEDIRTRIAAIQSSTDDTVREVGQISRVISQVNEIVATIALDIENQSRTATEVAESIDQAASGTHEVNVNVSQSSQVSSEIARDIAQVNAVADTISQSSQRMTQRAQELSSLALGVKKAIGVFKTSDQTPPGV